MQTKFPSSLRAVDEGTPVYSVVEDTNDQLSNKGIQRLPDNLESAQQEITALWAANQKLRQFVTPKQGNYRKHHWPRQDTKSNS